MTTPTSKPGKFGIIGGSVAAVLLAAAWFVRPLEGEVDHVYFDVVNVATWCVGHTGPDHPVPGKKYTKAECDSLLASDLGKTYTGIAGCVHRAVTPNQAVAMLSLGFNIGVRAFCKSTLTLQVNQGQPASVWCRQILRWDRAGGRQIKGLTRRREAEFNVCMRDVN
jgi:lysozyme